MTFISMNSTKENTTTVSRILNIMYNVLSILYNTTANAGMCGGISLTRAKHLHEYIISLRGGEVWFHSPLVAIPSLFIEVHVPSQGITRFRGIVFLWYRLLPLFLRFLE
jgi:hypothetical protein